jgi:Pro-kumamolisin, activation domain
MVFRHLSAFCHRALAIVGCAMAITSNSVPVGRQMLHGHVPTVVGRLKPVQALEETNRIRLALGLQARNTAELATLLHDLYNPSSPKFHQYLKPAEFAARFGPTEDDYAAASAFAKSHHLSVVQAHANRLLLDVEGSVADVKEAFHINMNVFQHPTENRTFYAPDREPSIEEKVPLLHIAGLDNYLLPKSNLRVRSRTSPPTAFEGSGPTGNYMGQDFRNAYAPGVTLDGSGQTVALVEFDGFATRDITTYESMAGLPNVPITAVSIDGFKGTPGANQDEVSLDIEMAISMAPGLSQVLCYEAPYGLTSVDDDLLNQIAVDDLANQISCSWYYTIDATTDLIFQEMAAQGQSFYNASGDLGAYYIATFPPMGDPNITIVGGTTLTTTGVGQWVGETVWNWFSTGAGTDASSGGISANYGIPYWQLAVNMSSNQGSSIRRNLPDVSMVADNVLVYTSGASETVGGTSCSAPLWAAFTALINQQAAQMGRPPVGFLDPAIYVLAQSPLYPSLFHDVTTGNNTNFNGSTEFYAVPGYDLCTGWGTPTGQALIDALVPPDNLIIEPRGGLTFAVAHGYQLPIETQTLSMKTAESTTITWAFGPLPAWLNASVSHGSVSPGLASFVTLAPVGAATNLPPGEYVTNLVVTNTAAGVTHLVPVFLEVFDPLLVSPDAAMTVTGPPGGPFNETSETYSLTNFASVPVDWTAQSTLPFVDLSATGGTLQPGDSTNVIVTLNTAASNLLITTLTGSLQFTDLNITNTQSLPLTLTLGNGGFETGDFSDWTLAGPTNADYNFVLSDLAVLNVPYIHSGEFGAFLGEPTNATLTETLPTIPNQLYQISFFLDNPIIGVPNQFGVNWGGNLVFNQTSLPQMTWTNVRVAVVATNTTTDLQFAFFNYPEAFGLDDITVTAMPSPAFTSAAISGNSIVFSWNSIPGASYQIESSTDLVTWLKVGFAIPATNTVLTAKETIRRADQQQFFKLVLQLP